MDCRSLDPERLAGELVRRVLLRGLFPPGYSQPYDFPSLTVRNEPNDGQCRPAPDR